MPSHSAPKKAPQGSPPNEQAYHSPQSLVERVSIGSTSREWRLPFDAYSHAPTKTLSFSGPNEYDTARNACDFLRVNAPALYTEWKSSYFKAFPDREAAGIAARNFNLPVAVRALVEVEPQTDRSTNEPSKVSNPHPLAPPRAIELPIIDEQHWYYRRHFNIGNYVMGARDPHAASVIEAQQDIASLRHYLSRYDALAREITGVNLFEATTWAAFRAPYFSCMELCIKDLHLPSHFLALVHYGIGVHLATGQQSNSWNGTTISPQTETFLRKTRTVFDSIAAMYTTDFPR